MNFDALLKKMVTDNASDLFITAGKPPCIKINGVVVQLDEPVLTPEKAKSMVFSLMDEQQQKEFITQKEYNFAIQTQYAGRFRVSAFFEKFNIGAVLRRIRADIPVLDSLGLPGIISELTMLKRGLILVAGATGVGKSTTLAAMIGTRNHNSTGHIVTIEDPIEFIHEHDKCIVTQREVGIDTSSYGIALKNTLRQAPDVILIGEIRSSDTMEYAIQFSETGHLCLATLHANNANQALDRIINFFPSNKHAQVWLELSLNLKAIIAQQLIPTSDGKGRVAAMEILINTPIVQSCIKRGDIDGLKTYMAKGQNDGMQTFDQALYTLYKNKKITYDEALKYADSENEFRLMVKFDSGSNKDIGSLEGVRLKE
jgi:twitching motility protein PilU